MNECQNTIKIEIKCLSQISCQNYFNTIIYILIVPAITKPVHVWVHLSTSENKGNSSQAVRLLHRESLSSSESTRLARPIHLSPLDPALRDFGVNGTTQ